VEIALLVPYYTGSHASWADGVSRFSRHAVRLFSLSGFFWKWRMHGGAVTLAREFLAGEWQPDLILATDMLDLTTFLALTRRRTHDIPTALYMHENQLTYPLPVGEKRDLHYGFINFASMLAADRVFFNSSYHLESFYDELPRLLKHFPDYNELPSVAALRQKSAVLPLGLDLARLDAFRPAEPRRGAPLVLWNHRWEYDKGPAEFLRALCCLADEGWDFQAALAGENFRVTPQEFEEARQRLGERVVQYGYVGSSEGYARLLWRADILPVTSLHDFFGASVAEAIYCDTLPLLPRRLTYPDFIPPARCTECLYDDFDGLLAGLRRCLADVDWLRSISLRDAVARYDWRILIERYDEELEIVARRR
jgi:glycosyltransferase involved in cell wall biosynthesis